MDKKETAIIISSLIISGVAVAYFYNKYYKKTPGIISSLPPQKSDAVKSILFVGDSNTEAPWSYADKIKKMYPNISVKKIAKHSMKTDWILNEPLRMYDSTVQRRRATFHPIRGFNRHL